MPGPQMAARGVRSSVSEDGEPLARVRHVDAKPRKRSKKGDCTVLADRRGLVYRAEIQMVNDGQRRAVRRSDT